MADGRCPRIKQIHARIVRYPQKSQQESCPPPSPAVPSICQQVAEENEQFRDRLTSLKCKLEEATNNIAMLRSWVGETAESIPQPKPKGPKQLAKELKELIEKIDQFQAQADVITDRGGEAMKLLEDVENQSCYCSVATESCEEIKRQLEEIADEKCILEDTLEKLKNAKHSSILPPDEMMDAVKNEISEVRACVDWNCPKIKNTGAKPQPSYVSSGVQNNMDAPTKKPKLSQTYENHKFNQGTSPCCAPMCKKK